MTTGHDEWPYAPLKRKRQPAIQIGEVNGVLPFSGVRNPLVASSTSHRAAFTYCVAANGMTPRIGLFESGAELAVAQEALLSPHVWNLECQPCTVAYEFNGCQHHHTFDLRLTMTWGERRLVFVRNRNSLERSKVAAEIDVIRNATPSSDGDVLLIVEANQYMRARRGNFRRMHQVAGRSHAADEDRVLSTIRERGGVCLVTHVADVTGIIRSAVFQSVLNLIRRGRLLADLDSVIGHYSRVWLRDDPR